MAKTKITTESREFHLELITRAIERMAANSFSVKQWAIGTFATLFTVHLEFNGDALLLYLLLLVSMVYWVMDSWFLRLERGYRKLFHKARITKKDLAYSMNVSSYIDGVPCLIDTMFSFPNAAIYLLLISANLTFIYFLTC